MTKFVEQEAKFRIAHPREMRGHVEKLGARLLLDRQHEMNTRFDRPDGAMKSAREVLRLRVDQGIRLTYKGPAREDAAVSVRTEIELKVDNVQAAEAFLTALGYFPVERYEKYRSTYQLPGAEIVLDELPYGTFLEIEGESEARIRELSDALGLNWDKRCKMSYLELFYRLNEKSGLHAAHLTFDDFFLTPTLAAMLEAEPADD